MGKLKTADVKIEIAGDLPTLHWCMMEVDCVILALLCNAAEACQSNPKNDQVVRLVARAYDGGAMLEFHDTGEGFRLADCSAPFRTTKAKHRNLGLGLSAVAQILASRNGTLEVENHDDGTCVRAYLPSKC